jgi:hypothetical protein
MTKDEEALKMALEALELSAVTVDSFGVQRKTQQAITAIKEALAQQEQKKPQNCGTGYCSCIECVMKPEQAEKQVTYTGNGTAGRENMTAPTGFLFQMQKREWVGLSDDEIEEGLLRSDYALQTAHAWRAGVVFAMTKLKEKNT